MDRVWGDLPDGQIGAGAGLAIWRRVKKEVRGGWRLRAQVRLFERIGDFVEVKERAQLKSGCATPASSQVKGMFLVVCFECYAMFTVR